MMHNVSIIKHDEYLFNKRLFNISFGKIQFLGKIFHCFVYVVEIWNFVDKLFKELNVFRI